MRPNLRHQGFYVTELQLVFDGRRLARAPFGTMHLAAVPAKLDCIPKRLQASMPDVTAHTIYPHGPLTEIAPGLWQVEGSLPMPLKRNMTVYRLGGDRLLLYSVVALDEAGMTALEALGKPAVMVVPHPMHVLDAPFYKDRYSGITVVAASDARARLGTKVKVDATPEEVFPSLGLSWCTVPGLRFTETVLHLDLLGGGQAMVVTDIIGGKMQGGFALRLLGAPGGSGVPRIVKFRQIRDKHAVRGFLRESAQGEDLRIIAVAHGRPIAGDVRTALGDFAARC